MAATICLVGTDITWPALPAGFSLTAEFTSLSGGISVGEDDVSSFTSTDYLEFSPKCLRDPGAMQLGIYFDPSQDPNDFVGIELAGIIFTWPILTPGNTTNATWTSDGFLRDYTFTGNTNDRATGSLDLRLSGFLTVTAEAA